MKTRDVCQAQCEKPETIALEQSAFASIIRAATLMTANLETLGVIAGSRSLPFLLARQARADGRASDSSRSPSTRRDRPGIG